MPDKTLKCAIIGAGNMGQNHIRAYLNTPSVKIVAACDVNQNILNKIRSSYNFKCYPDYKKMVAAEKPDIVSICVPTNYHAETAIYFLDNGINVLLEKPIATDLNQANAILNAAIKNKKKLLIGHIERFNPAVRKLKNMIDHRDLGKITAIIARRVGGFPPQIKDANIAVDLAIHDIDIINYLLGSLPSNISVNKQRHHIKQREDSVEFFLKYNKSSAYIQANWITPVKIRKLTITGTEGYLEMDYINQQIDFYKSNYEKFKEDVGGFSDYILRFSEPDKINISVAKKEPLMEELSYFVKCVQEDIEIDCQPAIEALKIALTN
ncbi:Gfo/Idh/MocA family oxidoreductase [Candidatus Peregrinibacteria bacterium]|nr:Gfo/Idh/MocA family oxidoreductase [Candidatus Peregrinibacteria bacterium]